MQEIIESFVSFFCYGTGRLIAKILGLEKNNPHERKKIFKHDYGPEDQTKDKKYRHGFYVCLGLLFWLSIPIILWIISL